MSTSGIKKITTALLITFLITTSGCEQKKEQFPIQKHYWSAEDYTAAVYELQYNMPKGKSLPKFSDPEYGIVVRKLADPQNFLVILEDKELGIIHKDDVAQKFFDSYRTLSQLYSPMDVQDKYLYPDELIAFENFGLQLQILYFKIGNDKLRMNDDTERIKGYLMLNTETIVKNFSYFLDNINEEKRFGDKAPLLAEGINAHFSKMIETFPEGNFEQILQRSKNLVTKTETAELKTALENLITKLESLKKSV